MSKLKTQKSTLIPILLLAAGASTRMGRPKQLLFYEGKTLIEHTTEKLLSLNTGPLLVVLGAHAEKIATKLEPFQVQTVFNERWKEGMGSGIAIGLQTVLEQCPKAEGVLITLVDQPELCAKDLQIMLDQYRVGQKKIWAAFYQGTLGVPAIFSRPYFESLLQLNGPQGAGKIIRAAAEKVQAYPLPAASFDLDTPEDWAQWIRSLKT